MAQPRNVVVGDYILLKKIGAGSFAEVWLGKHKVKGTEVAIKVISTLDRRLHDNIKSEISIMKGIHHPNIIHLYDIIQAPGKIYLVLEYCERGDLSKYIRDHRGVLPEATAKDFMQQLAAGLQVLWRNNIIHRDLKPQNLLLSSKDKKLVLKIGDFGIARFLAPSGLAQTWCGTPLYMAPEIMQNLKYDTKADLWSVGAILFQLVTGRTPFTGNNMAQLLQNITTNLRFLFDSQSLSSDCKDLCQKLLRPNPVERLNFKDFFKHPFLSQKQPRHGHVPPQHGHGHVPPQPRHGHLPPQPRHGHVPPQPGHGHLPHVPPQPRHGHLPPQPRHGHVPPQPGHGHVPPPRPCPRPFAYPRPPPPNGYRFP